MLGAGSSLLGPRDSAEAAPLVPGSSFQQIFIECLCCAGHCRGLWGGEEAGASPGGVHCFAGESYMTQDLTEALGGGRSEGIEGGSVMFRAHLAFVQLLSPVRLCDSMDSCTPGFPILHHLLEFAQTPVHGVGDAIQPSHPLLSPSPPALNLSQHQGFFQ